MNMEAGLSSAMLRQTLVNSTQVSDPEVIKNIMLNSAEHEILNAHNYKI